MKHIKCFLLAIGASCCLLLSCSKKEYKLESLPDESAIDMEVRQDFTVDAGGNTVYLITNTTQIQPVWDYGTGRSLRQTDTIRFAFKGDYVIKRSAITGGGIVKLDSVVVQVKADNLDYVNDPLWVLLSGGPGAEKVWRIDLDENGISKSFDSPVYFSGNELGWAAACTVPNGNCWTWFPKWADNTWLCPKADYGTMKFSLKDGPFVTVDQKVITGAGISSGTYYLDKDAKTITFTNATPLNVGRAAVFTTGFLISLTEEAMQIAFKHPTDASYEIHNYIAE